MHRSEAQRMSICSDCGAEIDAHLDRPFSFGARGVLCFDCALRRGGRFDEAHDRWLADPRIDDLGRDYE